MTENRTKTSRKANQQQQTPIFQELHKGEKREDKSQLIADLLMKQGAKRDALVGILRKATGKM